MPAWNLGSVIAANVRTVHDLFGAQFPVEIVVVDDGSDDNTGTEIERMARTLPAVKAVRFPRNLGKGKALCEGFLQSTGSHVLLLDADLDLPPAQAARFFTELRRTEADVVIGTKRHPESQLDYPAKRRLLSTGYFLFVKLLFGLPIRDTQTGIKLFKRQPLAEAVPRMLVKRFAFDLELLVIVHERGFRIVEAPIVLEFKGPWGCVTRNTVREILTDTLAIFYRSKVKHYYRDRHVELPEGA